MKCRVGRGVGGGGMGWVVLGKTLPLIPRISPSSFSTAPQSHLAAGFSGPLLSPAGQVSDEVCPHQEP